jgi:hypothetical protein
MEYLQKRVDELVKADPSQGGYMFLSWVKYILTTANTWNGPIGDFDLLVQSPDKEDIIVNLDGHAQLTKDTTFHTTRSNFVPDHELSVYFVDFH